ncbi:hypothetical protein D3C71_1526830 [compost metagenome]
MQAWHFLDEGHQSEVAEAVGGPAGHGTRIAGLDADRDVTVFLSEQPQRWRQHRDRQSDRSADQNAAAAAFANRGCSLLDRGQPDKGTLHFPIQRFRFGRGNQPQANALEQRQAQFLLQLGDEAADVGLRCVQLRRGVRHGAREHDGTKCFDLAVIHERSEVSIESWQGCKQEFP